MDQAAKTDQLREIPLGVANTYQKFAGQRPFSLERGNKMTKQLNQTILAILPTTGIEIDVSERDFGYAESLYGFHNKEVLIIVGEERKVFRHRGEGFGEEALQSVENSPANVMFVTGEKIWGTEGHPDDPRAAYFQGATTYTLMYDDLRAMRA